MGNLIELLKKPVVATIMLLIVKQVFIPWLEDFKDSENADNS